MAVARKGWRRISVAGRQYYWQALGSDGGIVVSVVTDEAFESGQTAQQLRFRLGYDHHCAPLNDRPGAWVLHQQAVVSPRVVRAAVEAAVDATPPFTGASGAPHIRLSDEALEAVQRLAHVPWTK